MTATTLHDILLAPETEPAVIADCLTLIQQEMAGKSGVSGTAIKLAYKTVSAFASGYLQSKMEQLVPQMVDRLEPFWADFAASGAADFGDYLSKRGDEASVALLSVTDERAERCHKPAILKAYRTVR